MAATTIAIAIAANGTGSSATNQHTCHAVSRSNELLSCAKTALKIAQSSTIVDNNDNCENPLTHMSVESLCLNPMFRHPPPTLAILEDGLTLLRAMEFSLHKLQALVRRRGHTNDPTEQISQLIHQLEQDTQELAEFVQGLSRRKTRSKQASAHWQLIGTWFQLVASHQSVQLKEILKLRGTVLADQAQRRKLVSQQQQQQQQQQYKSTHGGGGPTTSTAAVAAVRNPPRRPRTSGNGNSTHTNTPLFDSPLFTATQSTTMTATANHRTPAQSRNGSANNNNNNNGSQAEASATFAHPADAAGAASTFSKPPSSSSSTTTCSISTTSSSNGGGVSTMAKQPTASSYYASSSGYGGAAVGAAATATGGGGYGGGSGGGYGMRQRKGPSSSSSNNKNSTMTRQDESSTAVQMQMQIQERKQQRQTAQRVEEAQQAERQLGELGTLFGKMSTLISQQGEVLEKVEDDVEAALVDVTAGQEEITKLYHIKKGNRGLIIKTFAILIFLICFMRLYKK
jgi:hypothetical protein